ncbi:MAG: hypothetical protein MJ068_03825 [Clostridia bacterium]|nr:hypothetical protein [Clostridia bacterium]
MIKNPFVNSKGKSVRNYVQFKAYAQEIAAKWGKIESDPEKLNKLFYKYYETTVRKEVENSGADIQENKEAAEKIIQEKINEKIANTPEPLKAEIVNNLKKRDAEELNYVIKNLLVKGGVSLDEMKELFGDKLIYKRTEKELNKEGITVLKKADYKENEEILKSIIDGTDKSSIKQEDVSQEQKSSNEPEIVSLLDRRISLKDDAISSNLSNLDKIFNKIEELHKCEEDDYDLNKLTTQSIEDAKKYVVPSIAIAQSAKNRILRKTAEGKNYTLSLGFKQRSKLVEFNEKSTAKTLNEKNVPKYEKILETDDQETIEEKQFTNHDTISRTLNNLSKELNETIDENRKDLSKQYMTKAEKNKYLKARQYRQQHLNFTAENLNEFEEFKIGEQGYSDIAKTLNDINTFSNFEVQDKSRFLYDLNKIHNSRGLLSIILHPINYYREGKMIDQVKNDLKILGIKDAEITELTDKTREYNSEKYKGIDKVQETLSSKDAKLNKSENQDLNKKQSELNNNLKAVTNDKPLVENNKEPVKQEQKKEIKEPEQNIKPIGKNK